MAETTDVARSGLSVAKVLGLAAKLPGVRIDRSAYLRSALKRYCTEVQIQQAVATTPANAGVSLEVIRTAADTAITYETSKAAALSAAAGIPGGLAMLGTVPADLVQYVGHMLRVSQKLAYLYSWPDLFADDGDDVDEATEGVLMLFVGAMFGVQAAQSGLTKISEMIAAQVVKKLPQKALTKGVVYPIVKKVALRLGTAMNKTIFAGGVAKAIPIVGAALSGGLTSPHFFRCRRGCNGIWPVSS